MQTCNKRVQPRPYGHEKAYTFQSIGEKIILTWPDHWEILDFRQMATDFPIDLVQVEFARFEPEIAGFQALPEDFYVRYAAFEQFKTKHAPLKNPKIQASLDQLRNSFNYLLYVSPDSVMQRVAQDFAANRLDTALHCDIVAGLCRYYGYKGSLEMAAPLLDFYSACLASDQIQDELPVDQIKRTLHRLDSIARLPMSPDERLYANGKIWFDYSFYKRWFRYSWPMENLEQAFVYYRTLLKEYPKSAWADNAAYDMLHYKDYRQQDSSDDLPEGNLSEAYEAFNQFLQQYPDSECSSKVIARMLRILASSWSFVERQEQNLDTLISRYPDLVLNNEEFAPLQDHLRNAKWNRDWRVQVKMLEDSISWDQPILLDLIWTNVSGALRMLDSSFMQNWHRGLYIHLSQIPEKGCDPKFGDFAIKLIEQRLQQTPVQIAPGSKFEAQFVMEPVSFRKYYNPGQFSPGHGEVYQYNMELKPHGLPWLHMNGAGGRFYVR